MERSLMVRLTHATGPIALRWERRLEAREREADHAADEVLLRGEVVVERRDVHADRRGDLARSQTLEAARRQQPVSGRDQRVVPRLALSCRLTFNQSDD